jgi:pimeloyl-ACP methyl ester carboxylesterase
MLMRKMIELPNRQQVSYIEAGSAEAHTIVLLHGGGADNALLSWGPTMKILVDRGYHVVAPDHPGYGHSPKSVEYATMQNQVGYLNQFIAELGLRDYDLVGISMGGAMAIGHTLAYGDQVRRLTLVASYGYQATLAGQPFMMLGSRWPWLTETIQLLSWNPYVVSLGLLAVLNKSVVSEELAQGVQFAALETRAMQTFNEFQRHELGLLGNRTDFRNRLGEITQPVLLIHGEYDMIFPVSDARKAVSLLPNAQLEILPEVGHWAQRDAPDSVHELMLDFLSPARLEPVMTSELELIEGAAA